MSYTCTLPTMRTSRRLRGQPPEGQARREVGSPDSQEASPSPGFARESSACVCVGGGGRDVERRRGTERHSGIKSH